MSEKEQRYAAEIEVQRQRSKEAAEVELNRDYRAYLASLRGPEPVHDHDSLFLAYCYVRAAYASVRRLRQADPTIRDVATQLDEMASHIHTEIDAAQG